MYDLIVIGAGPAGLAAALAAYENNIKKILVIERDSSPGGILNQCIHNGFGLHYFKEELTGPEYAHRFIEMLQRTNIEIMLSTMVLNVDEDKTVYAVSKENGYKILKSKAVILSTGCRERSRGAISIPGDRPSGIFTAGAAQRYINIEGYMIGKRVVILGSGDIGLIMARRMILEGAEVLACVEIMPYSGGLTRNIIQCLEDYNIPLLLSHTVVDIKGDDRLRQVTVMKVDENRKPIKGSEIIFNCDTLLLSVGLIPENELGKSAGIDIDSRTKGPFVYENMQTSVKGIFASGNAVHVHDLVDFVTQESILAGKAAAEYINNGEYEDDSSITVKNGNCVIYTVPQNIRVSKMENTCGIFLRVNKIMESAIIEVLENEEVIASYKREYLAPGEMEKIILPRAVLEKIKTNIITVSIKEVV